MIAVNAAFYHAPWADLVLFTDQGFWDAHHDALRTFRGAVWTISRRVAEGGKVPRLFTDPVALLQAGQHPIRQAASTGQAAIATAISLGANRVGVLGLDLKPSASGETHWHSHYGEPNPEQVPAHFATMLQGWGRMAAAAGVRVVNFSPDSATDEFEKRPLATIESGII